MAKINLLLFVLLTVSGSCGFGPKNYYYLDTVNIVTTFQQVTPTPTSTPVAQSFLGPIFYGDESVWKIFDHNLPGNTLNNLTVTHYDGVEYVDSGGYGYNGHQGIDYSPIYEPVLAAADGTIVAAGWSDPANHRAGYGLHVKMSHTANATYQTLYGHLSTVTVQTGDNVVIDPADPGNLSRITGIAGNTGHVFGADGNCPPVPDQPSCGYHLHFEARVNNGGTVVDPYGWVAPAPTIDPWAGIGAASYNLWATPPAITSTQYSVPLPGPALTLPITYPGTLVIDNSSTDFSHTPAGCWVLRSLTSAYNNSYRATEANRNEDCTATWSIKADRLAPAGDYNLFAHIPNAASTALGARYQIYHNGQVSEAIAVQAAYPNDDHDAWAYLGRYNFAMDGNEWVRIGDETIAADDGNAVLADAIRLAPALAPNWPFNQLYLAFQNNGQVGLLPFANEDIVGYDRNSGNWSLYFDGSAVGLPTATVIDGFEILSNGTILFTFATQTVVPGLAQAVTGSDIVAFDPPSQTFSLYLEGAMVGLTTSGENIDSIAIAEQGGVLISTENSFNVNNGGLIGQDEDILLLPAGSSTWQLYFDGSVNGLANEDISGLWVEGEDLYLAVKDDFAIGTGPAGDNSDLFTCQTSGNPLTCLYNPQLLWNGSAHGPHNNQETTNPLRDFSMGNSFAPTECNGLPNCSFEEGWQGWQYQNPDPTYAFWSISNTEKHTGQNSAQVTIYYPLTMEPKTVLTSTLMPLNPNHSYRFGFWGKSNPLLPQEVTDIWADVYWYDQNGEIIYPLYPVGHLVGLEHWQWTNFISDFTCPPAGVTHFRLIFLLDTITLTNRPIQDPTVIFLDDITVENQTDSCPQRQLQLPTHTSSLITLPSSLITLRRFSCVIFYSCY